MKNNGSPSDDELVTETIKEGGLYSSYLINAQEKE